MKRLTTLILYLCCTAAYSQDPFLDSLNNLLASKPGDSVRASVLGDLCWHFKYSNAPKALAYGKEAADIAKKNGYVELEAYALNNIGVVYWAKSTYDSAAYYIKQTRDIYSKLGNERGMVVTSTNLGLILQNQGEYDQALDAQLEALRIAEKLNDPSVKGSVLTNIGNIYFLTADYLKAKKHYFEALALKREQAQQGMRQNIQKTLVNIGNVYDKLNNRDSAIYYFKVAEPYAIKAADNKNLTLIYTDLGHAYSKKMKYDTANMYFEKALIIFNEAQYENDYDQSILLWSLAENELRRKNIKAAVAYGERSLQLSQALNNPNRLKDAYDLLAEIYEASGQLGHALEARKKLRAYEDSVLNLETKTKIAELEKKYETEKKDREILFLNQENELQKTTNERNTLIITGLTVFVGLLILIFYLWRQRLRNSQQAVLNEQKIRMREAQIRAVINSEEKERKRFAADLHDSMGQLISALSMNIQSLRSQNGSREVRDEIFENSTQLLGDIQREVRNIAFNLMPQILVKEGFIAALEELITRINRSHQVKAQLQVYDLDQRFDEVYEISLYRILQEWISNVLKYSHATSIFVQLIGHEYEVVITVEDNGDGFDLKAFETGNGNGWRNINSRLSLISAAMDIDTHPGRKNTTLTISFAREKAFARQPVVENTDK